jgi:uncharacterized protein (DUF2147 family)
VHIEACFSSIRAFALRALAIVIVSAGGIAASDAATIEGTWRTQGGTEVAVVPCGSDYCGTLSWIVIPPPHSTECAADKAKFGELMIDRSNPDPSLRYRSLIGLTMMTARPTPDPKHFDIHLYNSEDGKSYDGAAEVDGDTLNLQQCMGFCVTVQSWPRVPVRTGVADFSCGG